MSFTAYNEISSVLNNFISICTVVTKMRFSRINMISLLFHETLKFNKKKKRLH